MPRQRLRLAPFVALLAPLAAALLAACGGPGRDARPSADAGSRRALPAGDVVGFTGAYGNHAWRGIPYAEPPVGGLRWRAPRPLPRWSGEREALASGAPCPQIASVYSGAPRGKKDIVGSEDCLVLDVYAPRLAPGAVPSGDAALPVMLWIHGGGNTIGSASFYDGGHLAAAENVIVVVVQYRLGALGWLRHAALRAEGGSDADRSGNFGTLDTIRALEWVRDNVAAFGGDPQRVTIFGESAGGQNVFALLLSPRARGLFQRAILESPSLGTSTPAAAEAFSGGSEPGSPHSSNELLRTLLQSDGNAIDREAARAKLGRMSAAEIAAYLRGKRAEQLVGAYADEAMEGMYWVPDLVREGAVLPAEDPIALLARAALAPVPILVGTNRDENKLFMAFDPEFTEWRFGLFPRALDPERYDAHAEALSMAWKARSVDQPAALLAAAGAQVYAYRWDWDEEPRIPFVGDGARLIGASHGLETAFVFGHFDLGPETSRLFTFFNRSGRLALSAQMMSYWAQFAYAGAPGRGRRGDLPEWKAWDASAPDAPKYAVLDTPEGGGIRLASQTVTMDDVLAMIATDPRFGPARNQCAVLRNLVNWEYIPRSAYASVDGAVCADYALEAYPWPDVAADK